MLSRPEPLHQQIAAHFRADIHTGVLQDGVTLPSTRELAANWGVSIYTINQAMHVLAEEGLVLNKLKSGRIVTDPDQKTRHTRPQVILIGGYSGTGKSTFARILARETHWPLLDKDTLTRPIVETTLEALGASTNDRESELYRTQVRPREYEALHAAVIDTLTCTNSVIAAAPFLPEFTDHRWLNRTRADCAQHGADLTLVWMHTDADTMHRYLHRRGKARDAAKLDNWTHYLSRIDLTVRPSGVHHVIDNRPNAEPLTSQARLICQRHLELNAKIDPTCS